MNETSYWSKMNEGSLNVSFANRTNRSFKSVSMAPPISIDNDS